jgi:hypothetical protein
MWCYTLICGAIYCASPFKGIVSAAQSGLSGSPNPRSHFGRYGFPISKLFWKGGHAILVALGNVGGVPDSCNLDFRLSVYRDFLPLNRKKTSRTPEEFALRQSSLRRLLA